MNRKKLAVIGYGNMAKAIVNGVLNSKTDITDILVFDINSTQYASSTDADIIKIADSMDSAIAKADAVLLSVKPQNFPEILPSIASIDGYKDKLYISIAAEMAVRCALTGHLVLTSIHSGSCVSAINRMMDLGVNEFQLSDTLAGIANQRLYDTADGQKIGVYEIMDRKEVNYYFQNHSTSTAFVPLSHKLQEAVQSGLVDPEQAEQDLS